MATVENSTVVNREGVYKHPETGAEVEIKVHPKFGAAMADGFVAAGFVYAGPLKAKEETNDNKKGTK